MRMQTMIAQYLSRWLEVVKALILRVVLDPIRTLVSSPSQPSSLSKGRFPVTTPPFYAAMVTKPVDGFRRISVTFDVRDGDTSTDIRRDSDTSADLFADDGADEHLATDVSATAATVADTRAKVSAGALPSFDALVAVFPDAPPDALGRFARARAADPSTAVALYREVCHRTTTHRRRVAPRIFEGRRYDASLGPLGVCLAVN